MSHHTFASGQFLDQHGEEHRHDQAPRSNNQASVSREGRFCGEERKGAGKASRQSRLELLQQSDLIIYTDGSADTHGASVAQESMSCAEQSAFLPSRTYSAGAKTSMSGQLRRADRNRIGALFTRSGELVWIDHRHLVRCAPPFDFAHLQLCPDDCMTASRMHARRCIDARRVSVSADIGTYAHDEGSDTHPGHVANHYRSGQSTNAHSLGCASSVAEQVPVPVPEPVVLSCTPETSRARLRPAEKDLAFQQQPSAIEPEYRQRQEFASALVERASWMARDHGQRFLPLSGGRDNADRTTNVSLRVPDKHSGSVQEIQFVMQNGAVRKRQEQSIVLAQDSFHDQRVWGLERPNAGTSSGVEYESRAMSAGSAEGTGEHQSEQSEQPRQRNLVDQYWMRTSSQGTARSSSSSSASSIFYEYSGSENTSPLGSPPASARRDSVGSSVKVCPRVRRMLARMLTRLPARRWRCRRPSSPPPPPPPPADTGI